MTGQIPPNPNRQAPPSKARSINVREVMFKVLDTALQVISIPIHAIEFFTGARGSAYLFGILAFYMLLVNAEGYLQSFGGGVGSFPDFTWKPFVNDPASLLQLIPTVLTRFWEFSAGFILSTAVQAIQAWAIRDWTPEEAKQGLDEVAKHKVPDLDPKSIDLAFMWQQRYKKAGTKADSHKGVLLLGVYAIDVVVAYANYPFLGVAARRLFANLVWFVLSVAGSELFFNAARDAHARAKASDKPKVQVM